MHAHPPCSRSLGRLLVVAALSLSACSPAGSGDDDDSAQAGLDSWLEIDSERVEVQRVPAYYLDYSWGSGSTRERMIRGGLGTTCAEQQRAHAAYAEAAELEAAGESEQADAVAYAGQEGLYDLPSWELQLQFPDEPTEGAAPPAMFLRVVRLVPTTDNPASPFAYDELIRGEPLVDGTVALSGDRLSGTMTFEGTYFEDIVTSDPVSEGEVTVTFDVGTCPVEDY